jgi:hypothetical protein
MSCIPKYSCVIARPDPNYDNELNDAALKRPEFIGILNQLALKR